MPHRCWFCPSIIKAALLLDLGFSVKNDERGGEMMTKDDETSKTGGSGPFPLARHPRTILFEKDF